MAKQLRMAVPAAIVVVVATLSLALSLAGRDPDVVRAQAAQLTLSLDAIPGNGNRPCDPIDATSTVAASTTHTVAICLSNYFATSGSPNGFEARVAYSTLDTAPEVADLAPALADNPNANDGAGPNGIGAIDWDCSVPSAQVFPKGDDPNTATQLDAFIVCLNFPGTGALTAEPGLLATITFQSGASAGTETLTFLDTSNVFNQNCVLSTEITCTGATITKQGGVAPTATNTATCGGQGQATCVPAATAIPGRLRTATPTATPPGPTETQAAGTVVPGTTPPPGGAAPTQVGGGAGAGGVRPPDTGSGPAGSRAVSPLWLVALIAAVGLGAVGAGAGALRPRKTR